MSFNTVWEFLAVMVAILAFVEFIITLIEVSIINIHKLFKRGNK